MHDAWTYEHTLHGRHHIDFILASHHWTITDGKANEIDLGSDRKAVRNSMHLRTKIISRRHRTKKIKRGWRPSDQYVGNLDEKLNEVDVQSFE